MVLYSICRSALPTNFTITAKISQRVSKKKKSYYVITTEVVVRQQKLAHTITDEERFKIPADHLRDIM